MRTVKLARNSVNEFVYDEHNERLLVYKTDGGILIYQTLLGRFS